MRIKNVGKCLIVFNGGSLPVGKVADFRGDAEKIGVALLKAYPDKLLDLDHITKEDVVPVVIGKAEEPETPKKVVAKKTTKKTTKSKKK